MPLVVGVLSDTHGRLHPEVIRSLEGVAHIIHAGDIGSPEVLTGLGALAPVTAVRGNCDFESWAQRLPVQTEVELGGARILVAHIGVRPRFHRALAGGPAESGYGMEPPPDVVVSGHTHKAEIGEADGVLYLNPGSAGPQRFGRSRTVARLYISPAKDGARPSLRVESVMVGGES